MSEQVDGEPDAKRAREEELLNIIAAMQEEKLLAEEREAALRRQAEEQRRQAEEQRRQADEREATLQRQAEEERLQAAEREALLQRQVRILTEAEQKREVVIARREQQAPMTPQQVANEVLPLVSWNQVKKVTLSLASVALPNQHASKVKSAKIPSVPGTRGPSMLLDRLFTQGHPISKGAKVEDFDGVMGGFQCVVLLGPSGAGKTRKLLELLRSHLGYYLIFRGTNDKNPGSLALATVMNKLVEEMVHVDWTRKVGTFKDASEQVDPIFAVRREAVHFAVKCVLGAYVFVYKEWYKNQRLSKGETMKPSQWLLAQLYPNQVFGRDIFEELALALFTRCDPHSWVSKLERPESQKEFICVIDEAQVLGSMMQGDFNTKGNRYSARPLLSPVLSGVRAALSRDPVISGTGLSLSREWKSIVSEMATDPTRRFVFYDFQPLTPAECRILLQRTLNCKDDPRLNEAAEMLSGRPRFVTFFIETAVAKNLSISQLLNTYVTELTDPDPNLHNKRSPAFAFARLEREPEKFMVLGLDNYNPCRTALVDAFWVSVGYGNIVASNPALIELGLGYAEPTKDDVQAFIRNEPLVLEAACRCRDLDSEFQTSFLKSVQTSAAELGNRFEYVATDRLLAQLCNQAFEMSPLLQGFAGVPQNLRTTWELPKRYCGRLAYQGDDKVYGWMMDVLNPASSTVRVRRPSNSAGPDLIVVPRNAAHNAVAVFLVQYKYATKFVLAEALLTVDPSKLFHQNRGKSEEHVLEGHAKKLALLLKKLANVPVVRVLVSGASKVDKVQTSLVPHTRGKGGSDLLIVVDNEQLDIVFGKELAEVLRALKE